jgi:hypothetical protein
MDHLEKRSADFAMLDWSRLNSYRTSPATSFEELCYQLARISYGQRGRLLSINDSGGGDGVEFILDLSDGTEWGWQAKFYPEGRLTSSRRRSIEDSLKTAVAVHGSRLTKWFLCTPLNLVIKGSKSEITWFREVLPTLAPGVELEFWGASQLAAMLQDPAMGGIRRFFFGDLVLSPQWFKDRFTEQRANVGDRYDPELHTETNVEAGLHALCGDEAFQAVLDRITDEIGEALLVLRRLSAAADPQLAAAFEQQPRSGSQGDATGAEPSCVHPHARALLRTVRAAVRLRRALRRVKAEIAVGNIFEETGLVARAEKACIGLQAAVDGWGDAFAEGDDGLVQSALRYLHRAVRSSYEVRRLSHPDLHVFGEPGIGKSHVCCNLVQTSLRQDRPALMLLGSTFSSGSHLQNQILDQVSVPAAYGWDEFLEALNTCSAVYRTRALIVLDGLNEAPGPDVWRDRLPGLIASIARYPRIALVTTCRELYREQIWHAGEPPNAVQADGFEPAAVATAVQKYLARFGLRASLDSGSLEAFRRPIYLALFCRLHQGERGIEREIALETQTLYEIFDAYLTHTDTLIRKRLDRGARSLLKNKLIGLADRLWELKSRALTLDEVCTRLDGVPEAKLEWLRSFTYAVLDAALLLRRLPPMEREAEWVEFSYDLFAGYLIAQSLLTGRSAGDVDALIRSTAFVEAIASEDFEKRHPLHEDIFRALTVARPDLIGIRAEQVPEPAPTDGRARTTYEPAEDIRPVTPLPGHALTVNFNQDSDRATVIQRRRLHIPQSFWFPWFRLRKSIDVVYHRIWVEVAAPKELRMRDFERLVEIHAPLLQTSTTELRDIRISTEEFLFDIVLNGQAILDVENDHLSHADIEIKVGLEPRRGQVMVEALTVRLDLVRAVAHPRCFVRLDPAFEAGYEHRRERSARLGTLYIENATPVRYAEPADCLVFVPSEQPPLPPLVAFGPASYDADAAHVDRGPGGTLRVRGLAPQRRVAVPLFVDLARLPNPTSLAEFISHIALESQVNGAVVQHPPCVVRYRVQPNGSVAALYVAVAEAGSFRPLDASAQAWVFEPITWVLERAGSVGCFTLRIGNTAERGTGRVQVRAFQLDFDDSASIQWKAGSGFRVDRHLPAELAREYEFRNEPDSHRDFTVSFRHDEIQDLSDDVVALRCRIYFEWRELNDAAEATEWRRFKANIAWQVERDAGPGWLAIDFGTAAIAVAGPAPRGGAVLIDLQQSLRQRLDPRDYTPEEVPEFGTPFASASVRLVPTHCLDAPNRARSIVDLAPLRRDLVSSRYPLPHVKALMGTHALPDLTGRLREFVYRPMDGAELRVVAEYPIRTEALLREAYARLLTDFVAPALGVTWPRKVVVTVPNGFTSRHAGQIRSLLTSRFPLRREYVTFISESDAVACFYVYHWQRLNQQRAPHEREALRPGDEHILIYDMGAGTLDLTYARIRSDRDGVRDVTVLGDVGSSAAGDYLDYLIAKEIYQRHQPLFRYSMFGPSDDRVALSARTWLKRIVREQIKPALDGATAIRLRSDDGYLIHDIVIDPGSLRSSAPVIQFLRESTAAAMENFFALCGGRPGEPYRRGSLPLDTVVFSGRSTQLGLLRDAVAAELRNWSGNEALFLVDDLSPEERKGAVVMGATLFAEIYRRPTPETPVRFWRRNLQARYGLLYRHPQRPDAWVFRELLNPSTLPVSSEPVMQDGMAIHQYDTDIHDADPEDSSPNVVNLTQTAIACFVQSFAMDTAGDANNGRWEYITRMEEVNVEHVTSGGRLDRVPVRIVVDEQSQMTFQLGRQRVDPVAPFRMNLTDSRMFREGMWPLSLDRND